MTLMLVAGMPKSIFAQDKERIAEYTFDSVGASMLPDNQELERRYINGLFYGGGISLYKDYGESKLTGQALNIYRTLRTEIEKIAAGERTSTTIEVTVTDNSTFNDDFNDAVNYLLVDLPASFYWYDKTESLSVSPATSTMTISFPAAKDYMGADNTTVNNEKILDAKKPC